MFDPSRNLFAKDEANKVLIFVIVTNILLVVVKLWAGYLSSSKALIADGLHSASDVVATTGVLIGLIVARKPRDDAHQYGHEKIETIVTFLLAIILIYTGFQIGMSSVVAIVRREAITPTRFALYTAFASIVLKEFQYHITMRVGKKINSSALIADAWHHRSDALSSVAAWFGILGARMGFYFLDPLAGVTVSVIVMKVGFNIFKSCFHELIDVSIHPRDLEKVRKLILKQEHIQYINDIRSRKHGSKVYIDVKVCVNPYLEVYKGHEVAEEVEKIIKSEVVNVKDVVVHLDPCFRIDNVKGICKGNQCKND